MDGLRSRLIFGCVGHCAVVTTGEFDSEYVLEYTLITIELTCICRRVSEIGSARVCAVCAALGEICRLQMRCLRCHQEMPPFLPRSFACAQKQRQWNHPLAETRALRSGEAWRCPNPGTPTVPANAWPIATFPRTSQPWTTRTPTIPPTRQKQAQRGPATGRGSEGGHTESENQPRPPWPA